MWRWKLAIENRLNFSILIIKIYIIDNYIYMYIGILADAAANGFFERSIIEISTFSVSPTIGRSLYIQLEVYIYNYKDIFTRALALCSRSQSMTLFKLFSSSHLIRQMFPSAQNPFRKIAKSIIGQDKKKYVLSM